MTVSTVVNHNDYIGNGVTTSFPYTFRIFTESNLVVEVTDTESVTTTLTLNTDYTVTGAGTYQGGSVLLNTPLDNGFFISIVRHLTPVQETDLRNQGKFFPETHEDALDYLTMLIQQCLYGTDLIDGKAVKVPERGSWVAPNIAGRRNKIFAWGDSGQPLAVLPESGSAADVLIELAKPTGATLVYNGSETVAAQLDRLLKNDSNVFHVDNFGAKGNGVLSADKLSVSGDDDTAAFIAAIAAAKAAGGGKVIASSGKTYLLTYTLLYPSNFVFDGQGCSLLWNPRNGDASLMLPETFQVADNTTYTTDVIWRNFTYLQIRNDVTPVFGNMFGVMKGKRILLEDVYVPYIYWHILDGAGGKDVVVRRVNADYGATSAIQFDSSANGNSAAVYAVDASGNKLLCAAGDVSGSLSGFEYSENCFVNHCNFNSFQHSAFHLHGGGCRSIFISFNKTNNCFAGARSDATTSHNEINITHNIFGNGTYGAYLLAQHVNINFDYNIIYSPSNSTANPYVFAVVANDSLTANKRNISLIGNKITGYQRGIQVHNYTNINCSENSFYLTGGGLPSSLTEALGSAVGCIVIVDCVNSTASNNTFSGCNARSCIIVKSSIDGTTIGPATVTGNTSTNSCGIIILRYLNNATATGNSCRTVAGSFYGVSELGCVDSVIANNTINLNNGQAGIYSQSGTATTVSLNTIRSSITTGYGIQFYAAASPRSSMNVVTGFTSSTQVYLDSTTSSGRHCEPYSTLGKASGASGTNYTPAGTPM